MRPSSRKRERVRLQRGAQACYVSGEPHPLLMANILMANT